MTRLSQIIAVEKGVKSDAERTVNEARTEVGNSARLSGISRTYQPRDDEGDHLPPESTLVQVKTEDVLTDVAKSLTRLFDVTLTKDAANCHAVADVKLPDGTVLLPKVPVTYLLFLQRQVAALATFVARLPLLEPAEDWGDAPDPVSGCWRTAPSSKTRPKKVPRAFVAYEATATQPAQVQVWQEDVIVGDWTTVKFSGAVPARRVRQISDRLTVLTQAVKYAREEANATEITDKQAGAAVFGWLLAP